MFKNATIYRLSNLPAFEPGELEERAQAAGFTECPPSHRESAGWGAPRGDKHAALVEWVGTELILRLTRESRNVPAATVKRELDKRLDKIEADTGRRPKGKRAKELKEEVVHELLPRAFPKRSSTPVWVSPAGRLVVVGAGNLRASDLAASLLVQLLGGGVSLTLLNPQTSPSSAMAAWLKDQEAPAGFSIDRECELKQPDSEKAAVKYSRHTLDTEEVAHHVEMGKLPTQLALTWNGRVSFVLTEALVLKRIQWLDVVLNASDAQADAFDADAAIATGELSQLIPDLLSALDGEKAPDLVGQAAQPN